MRMLISERDKETGEAKITITRANGQSAIVDYINNQDAMEIINTLTRRFKFTEFEVLNGAILAKPIPKKGEVS